MGDADTWRTAEDGAAAPRVVDLEGTEHGFAVACYREHQDEIWPTLTCLCGMWFAAPTWQDAGESFDDHLEDVSDGPP